MVKSKTFGKDLRLLVIESFKNGFSTKKIFENVQKTASQINFVHNLTNNTVVLFFYSLCYE